MINTIRKYWLFLLCIPVFLGLIGYFVEWKQDIQYTATTKIGLGNFDDTSITDPYIASEQIKSTQFLEEFSEKAGGEFGDAASLKGRLSVEVSPKKYITVSLSDSGKSKTFDELQALTDFFMKKSNQKYDEKNQIFEQRIQQVIDINSKDEQIMKQNLLYNLQIGKASLEPNTIVEPVTLSSTAINPMRRGVMGFIVGWFISAAFVFLPILLKKDE